MRSIFGYILTGSLTEGFVIRIAPHADLKYKNGKVVSIDSKQHKFSLSSPISP